MSPDDLADRTAWVSPPVAGREIGVSAHIVRTMIRDGQIPAVRMGRRWLISRQVLADYIERLRGQAS